MNGTRLLMCLSLATAIGCGSAANDTSSCGGSFETSCDLPNDNGAHTCYDVVEGDAAAVQQAKTTCSSAPSNGTVLSACCNHDGAVARCVFTPTSGGQSTEWFLSGTVAAAQSACAGKNGTFTTP
jgi:hypothetical protein